jgi:hypothetical protein
MTHANDTTPPEYFDLGDLDGEDLACAGLRRADRIDFFGDRADRWAEYLKAVATDNRAAAGQPAEVNQTDSASLPRVRKPRRPTLASTIKQANAAGITLARVELKPDGSISIIPGTTPEPAASENPWLVELRSKEAKR